jgi:uncharacterized phage protein (TIGR01671 family)
MREIMFRGKRTDNHEWVEGFVSRHTICAETTYLATVIEIPIKKFYEDGSYEVDESTVGQFTGLLDNSGKKIFSGDILRNVKTGKTGFVVWHGTMAGFILIKLPRASHASFEWGELFRAFDSSVVIGNVHDNPELLEASHDLQQK